MRVLVTCAWGRPMAIETQIRLTDPDAVVKRWPNLDELDPLTWKPRDPDVNHWDDEDLSAEGYYQKLDEVVRDFDPDLIITSLLEEAAEADLKSRYGRDRKVFCVSAAAAQLEYSRSYAREICRRHGVSSTRAVKMHDRNLVGAWLEEVEDMFPVIVKPDSAGDHDYWRSAVRCDTMAQLNEHLSRRPIGAFPVIVEEFVRGIEVAFAGLVDGRRVFPMLTDFEYTKLAAGDVGPETVEMGIHDVAGVSDRAREEVFGRLAPWFGEVGYRGWFDASCVYDPRIDRLSIFEFQTRMGSSQTENLMMMLRSPFSTVAHALESGSLSESDLDLEMRNKHAVSVVVVGQGHPNPPHERDVVVPVRKTKVWPNGLRDVLRDPYSRLSRIETVLRRDGRLYARGPTGRHLCAVGASNEFHAAKSKAYAVARACEFDGSSYRVDIGHRWENMETRAVLGEAGLLPRGWSRKEDSR